MHQQHNAVSETIATIRFIAFTGTKMLGDKGWDIIEADRQGRPTAPMVLGVQPGPEARFLEFGLPQRRPSLMNGNDGRLAPRNFTFDGRGYSVTRKGKYVCGKCKKFASFTLTEAFAMGGNASAIPCSCGERARFMEEPRYPVGAYPAMEKALIDYKGARMLPPVAMALTKDPVDFDHPAVEFIGSVAADMYDNTKLHCTLPQAAYKAGVRPVGYAWLALGGVKSTYEAKDNIGTNDGVMGMVAGICPLNQSGGFYDFKGVFDALKK